MPVHLPAKWQSLHEFVTQKASEIEAKEDGQVVFVVSPPGWEDTEIIPVLASSLEVDETNETDEDVKDKPSPTTSETLTEMYTLRTLSDEGIARECLGLPEENWPSRELAYFGDTGRHDLHGPLRFDGDHSRRRLWRVLAFGTETFCDAVAASMAEIATSIEIPQEVLYEALCQHVFELQPENVHLDLAPELCIEPSEQSFGATHVYEASHRVIVNIPGFLSALNSLLPHLYNVLSLDTSLQRLRRARACLLDYVTLLRANNTPHFAYELFNDDSDFSLYEVVEMISKEASIDNSPEDLLSLYNMMSHESFLADDGELARLSSYLTKTADWLGQQIERKQLEEVVLHTQVPPEPEVIADPPEPEAIPDPPKGESPWTDIEKDILFMLFNKPAMTALEVCSELNRTFKDDNRVSESTVQKLLGPSAPLQASGIVANRKDLGGYYRTDAPPSKY